MDDMRKLEALRNWLLSDDGSKGLVKASAVRAYEMMASYLRARLSEGRFKNVAGLRCFAHNLEQAIRSDMRHGADQEDGKAMLAFWSNALAFLGREADGEESGN